MACRACRLALVVAVVLLSVQGNRVDRFWPTVHCTVETESKQLCWQGPKFEGRLGAICGGAEVNGECKRNGYGCDVSGASLQRFTAFLGLSVFAKTSESGTCTDEHVDLNKAVMMGALQNNKLCPDLMRTVRHWHETSYGTVSNFTTLLAGCSQGVKHAQCTQTMTDVMVPLIISQFFESFEWTYGIKWAEIIVFGVDNAPAIEQAGNVADHFVDIPEGVKNLAALLRVSLKDPAAVAKKLLPKWRAVRDLLSKGLEPFLKPIIYPMMGVLLAQFPEMYEDNVKDALVHSAKLHAFQAAVKEKLDSAVDSIEKLCLFTMR